MTDLLDADARELLVRRLARYQAIEDAARRVRMLSRDLERRRSAPSCTARNALAVALQALWTSLDTPEEHAPRVPRAPDDGSS